MATGTSATIVSRDDYLVAERASLCHRREWIDGETREVPGASHYHGMIVSNIVITLGVALRGRPFVVHAHDMRIPVLDRAYYYPDVVVVPHPPEFEDERSDIVLNPLVVIEVLSPSTKTVDRGEKLDNYRRIVSLTDYLVVSRDEPAVDHWSKRDAGDWRLSIVDDPASQLPLTSLNCTLPMSAVYDRLFDGD